MLFSSCIEQYKPDISKYEEILVVDGKLTNLPGPYTVRLSKSYKFEENKGLPVSGAQLEIIDNTGLEIELKETEKGTYITSDSAFRGEVGKSYKLQIKENDQVYESSFELLKEPIPVDSIYWEYIKSENGEYGIQLLLNTHDPKNKTRYYGWDYVETWKFAVPVDYPDHPDRRECYKSSANYFFNIATTINRYEDVLERQPLQFIGENINKLHIRYSIQVVQYVYNEQSYKYIKDLISVNQNQGTLFDPIPYSLKGNIRNLSNETLPVLGYFMVAGASERRIFIDKKELPKEYNTNNGFGDCAMEALLTSLAYEHDLRQDRKVDSMMRKGYDILIKIIERSEGKIHLFLARPRCYDCTMTGTNIKPDFWTEN